MQCLTRQTTCAWILIGLCAATLSGCGGGGSDVAAPPPPTPAPPPGGGDPATAAKATADNNPMCASSRLGGYYWEIGDANGVLVSGTVGSGAPSRTTPLWIYSASKWLYAANVVQKHGGVVAADVPFLNFTSGYSNFGNAPVCVGDTVGECLLGRDSFDSSSVGRFKYDSGHMQHHAASVMNLGNADNAALAADLNATVGNFGFEYTVPQLAAGVVATSAAYASFLQKMMRGELALGAALGADKVCANPSTPGCNALAAPDEDTNEALNYGLGHWLEDDPSYGDHAYSSPGGGGFYPWVDNTRTLYGIVARERPGNNAGFSSMECGRLIRQAWRTGVEATSTMPSPTQ